MAMENVQGPGMGLRAFHLVLTFTLEGDGSSSLTLHFPRHLCTLETPTSPSGPLHLQDPP